MPRLMPGTDPSIPTVMPTSNRPLNMGASLNDDASRLDGVAKVTGRAKYGRDMYLPNGLFVAFIRCPWGSAELESSEKAAALAVPGVLEVNLSGSEGKYHGASVGYLVAESHHAMRRGMRALACKWKRRSVKTKIEDGLDDDEGPKPEAETKELLDKAPLKLEAIYSTQVQTHSSLETHGGSIDFEDDHATVYASTQGTSSVRDGLGDAIGLPRSKWEVVCEYVGGGFGSKLGGPGKEIATAAEVASKYKRPAYCFVNRAEEHLDTGNRPSSRTLVRIGFNKDGSILGGEIRTWGGTGVARGGGGASVPSGRYDLGEIKRHHADVAFNAGGPRPFRAPGHPQGAFAEELMLDEIATLAGIDPLDLRLKIDKAADRREMMGLGAKLIGWDRRQKTGSQTGPVRRGFGMGGCSWGSPPPGGEAEVVIHPDGAVEARTGTQDIGTGQRTSMGICAATTIGVPLKLVTVRIGHSNLPPGPGSGGSVTSPISAPTMMDAAEKAKAKLLEHIAKLAGADAKEFDIADGAVRRNGATHMSWADACAKLPADGVTGRSGGGKRAGKGSSNGVQFVELEVDAETGLIHVKHVIALQACGQVVCRKTAESQIIGGVIQGLSYALFEDRILDRVTGAMVNPNMDQYKILGPADMPHIEPILWNKSKPGEAGVKSLGEPPTVPTAGAVACAVFNAIGRPVRSIPLTPDKVLAALEGGAA